METTKAPKPIGRDINRESKQWLRRLSGVFVNLVLAPGLGSFIIGRRTEGTVQLFFLITGFALSLSYVILIAWCFALVSSFLPMKENRKIALQDNCGGQGSLHVDLRKN